MAKSFGTLVAASAVELTSFRPTAAIFIGRRPPGASDSPARVGAAHAQTLRGCTVLWLAYMAESGWTLFADASRASWFMFGAGGHMVWIDPDNEAVVVARWLDGAHSAGFVRRVAQSLGS